MPGHRCILGCEQTGAVLHVFPNPKKFPERFKLWIDIIGGKPETLTDYDFFIKKRICDIHFKDEHKNRYKRLSVLAIPCKNLPGGVITENSGTDNPTALSTSSLVTTGGAMHQFSETDIPTASSTVPLVTADGAITENSGTYNPTALSTSSLVTTGGAMHQYSETDIPTASSTVPLVTTDEAITENSGTNNPTALSTSSLVTTGCAMHQYSETDIPTASSTVPLVTTDETRTPSVWKEHNYSAISKLERKRPKKDVLLSYQAKENQRQIKLLRSNICRWRTKSNSLKQRLANAVKLSSDASFQRLFEHMKEPARLFINMQKQSKKTPKGRRFSLREKILCLSLYKKSAKCYRLLSNYFTLPSSRSMMRLLSRIKIEEGVNKIIFEKIQDGIRELELTDRLCILMFDEMSITPQIFYNSSTDKLSGFASNHQTKFTDHALVFMIKGVQKNFKQPVAYYFTNSLNKYQLKALIKLIAREVMQAGLRIVATVCDQSTVNVGAISELVEETKATYLRRGKECKREMISFSGCEIIPLFDTPHLIKGIRNNLLNKDLAYTTNNEEKIVKWEYFETIYYADKAQGDLKLLNKITEEHINKEKINKMRVKSATQLFSHSVAVVASHLAARDEIPKECEKVIDITLLLDNLFDSLNGSTFNVPNGKIFKGPLQRNSPHHELWKKAIEILNTAKFIKTTFTANKVRLTETIAPSLKNLIKTVKGMQSIWEILHNKYHINTVLTRNFNQDPVENFFGSIRSYGARNVAPNTVCFEGAYKALLVNNMNSPHSRRANCEEDNNECLNNLDFYLKENVKNSSDTPENFSVNFDSASFTVTNQNDAGQSNYVCGWVIRKCLKNIVKGCENCKLNLLENKTNKNNQYIKCKEYNNKKWLCYPNEETEVYFKSIQNVAVSILKQNVPKSDVKKSIVMCQNLIIDCPFKCSIHSEKLEMYFVDVALNVLIYSWTRSVNRILSGKLTYDGEDETKIAAQVYYNKHKHYKNRK